MATIPRSREIVSRILAEGDLCLDRPAHVGNGDIGEQVDLPIVRHPVDGRPVLRGDSVAGVLRSWLCDYECGYFTDEGTASTSMAVTLFGAVRGDPDGPQSVLIVDDALLGEPGLNVETRDGVVIDRETETAKDEFKFNTEFIEAGHHFHVRFELIVTADADEEKLKSVLALALQAFERGDIAVGARTSRGFGRCHVEGWRVQSFDMRTTQGLLGWLQLDHTARLASAAVPTIVQFQPPIVRPDKRRWVELEASFALCDAILIRSDSPSLDEPSLDDPDVVHIRSMSNGQLEYVMPGTSVAGVLSARSEKILNTVGLALSLNEGVFGSPPGTQTPTSSRLFVDETDVATDAVLPIVQARNRIEALTGGTARGALFNEQVLLVCEEDADAVTLRCRLRQPPDDDPLKPGLLLYLLKDLWTSDLPIGGESGVGRGYLRGRKATLRRHDGTAYTIETSDTSGTLKGDLEALESLAEPFSRAGGQP